MYLTYEEYIQYGGTLGETAFDEFAFEASSLIDYYTFNRLHNRTWLYEGSYPPAVKRCMMKLIKTAQLKATALQVGQNDDGADSMAAIQSQSNDGVSISYNVMNASEAFEQSSREAEKCIKTYLSNVYDVKGRKLTYRGMYPGEERVYK